MTSRSRTALAFCFCAMFPSSDGAPLAFAYFRGPHSLRTPDFATSANLQSAQFPDDGHERASRAPIQRPDLLAGYAARPPWKVAGVDYAVGVPADTVLVDWHNLRGPGISIVGNLVRIDNTSGAHIGGVDFALHGGAILLFVNSPGGVVTNSNFQATTSAGLINADEQSPDLTVQYCTMSGGSGGSSLISAHGNVVVQFSWMKEFPQHAVELGGNNNLTYRYNLIENGGTAAGAHLNYLQMMGSAARNSIRVEFNTTYQTRQAASGEGFQLYVNNDGTNSSALVNPSFAYNTMMAKGRLAMSYMVHGSSRYSTSKRDPTLIEGDAVVHDNYFDTTGAYGAFYPGSLAQWKVFGNWNMVTGTVIR